VNESQPLSEKAFPDTVSGIGASKAVELVAAELTTSSVASSVLTPASKQEGMKVLTPASKHDSISLIDCISSAKQEGMKEGADPHQQTRGNEGRC
jgi:hypothetical protein